MTGWNYIRGVFKDLYGGDIRGVDLCGEVLQGADRGVTRQRSEFFMMAALDVLRELESPMKEEALVRLVVMEAEEDGIFTGPKRVGLKRGAAA